MGTATQDDHRAPVLLGIGLIAAFAVITVVAEKRYKHWWARNEPFIDTRVRVAKALNRATEKYENSKEWAGIFGTIALGVAIARESARPPASAN